MWPKARPQPSALLLPASFVAEARVELDEVEAECMHLIGELEDKLADH